jgi:hypothetical protein
MESLKDLNNIVKSSTTQRLKKVIVFLSYSYLIPWGFTLKLIVITPNKKFTSYAYPY